MKVEKFCENVILITEGSLSKREKTVELIKLTNDNRNIDIREVVVFLKKNNFEQQVEYAQIVYGTFLRLWIASEFKKCLFLQENIDGIVLGGSMSYGPFYNIRHYDSDYPSSDIDLIVVTTDLQCINFNCLNSLIEDASVKSFERRKKLCTKDKSFDSVDMFSHRFTVAGENFYVSIHFVGHKKFKEICSLSTKKQGHSYLEDYKENPYRKDESVEFSVCRTEVLCKTPSKKVTGGFIAKIPWYGIINGEIVPGLCLNNISPKFNVFEGSGDLTKKCVQTFKDIIIKNASYKNGSIYKAHIREERFMKDIHKVPNLLV